MATRRTCGVVCGVVLMLTCMTTAAWAQFASSLEGTITDSTGGLVPGASVTILNEATGATQTVTTTGAGYYRFTALPGATYTVRVTPQWIQDRRAGAHRPAVSRDPDRQRHPRVRPGRRRGHRLWSNAAHRDRPGPCLRV